MTRKPLHGTTSQTPTNAWSVAASESDVLERSAGNPERKHHEATSGDDVSGAPLERKVMYIVYKEDSPREAQ